MQDIFHKNKNFYDLLRITASDQRLTKYNAASNGDSQKAIDLYYWNSKLSESLYIPLQAWEIALRNKINLFLCWKYGTNWPFTEKGTRQLKRNEQEKLDAAIGRQTQNRGSGNVSVGSVVADLSPGFWVALLSKRYAIPFVWSKNGNLRRVFPNEPNIPQEDASDICNKLLDLRNRVAHHEPIFHLPLDTRRAEMDRLLTAMCAGSHGFTYVACQFSATWAAKPH